MLNGKVIDLAPYRARPELVDGLSREELAALLEQLKGLEGRVMARLLLGATAQPAAAQLSASRPKSSEPDRKLNAKEIADELGVNRRWVFRHAKELPFVERASRKALSARLSELRRWLESQKA